MQPWQHVSRIPSLDRYGGWQSRQVRSRHESAQRFTRRGRIQHPRGRIPGIPSRGGSCAQRSHHPQRRVQTRLHPPLSQRRITGGDLPQRRTRLGAHRVQAHRTQHRPVACHAWRRRHAAHRPLPIHRVQKQSMEPLDASPSQLRRIQTRPPLPIHRRHRR